ncbi:MAG: copper amine oxidase [Paenibacillus sp.]|nr:copper amine oxidase [Paenibacillus sp.]
MSNGYRNKANGGMGMSGVTGWKRIGRRGARLLVPVVCLLLAWPVSVSATIEKSEAALPVEAAAVVAFSDISGHWGKATIEWAVSQGIVDGFADGTFKPDRTVNEAEFLTMLLRAYVGSTIGAAGAGSPWYAPYYAFASEMRWPVESSRANAAFKRGQVARLIAASQGQDLNVNDAVAYLLTNGLAQGKTSNTPAGFGSEDTLTRAEAVQFIRNLKGTAQFITGLPEHASAFAVRGVSVGDTVDSVQARLGAPARIDPSEYGFEWYIYNADYASYVQIGILNGKVVGLYTNTAQWTSTQGGISAVSAAADVVKALGRPFDSITKGNTRFILNNPGKEDGVYKIDGSYVTLFYDTHENSRVEAIQIIAQGVEEAKTEYYGTQSDSLRVAFEREVFDLANAARVKRGLQPFAWDDQVAGTARKHSADMAVNGYFDHTSPSGVQLKDRFKADGVSYSQGAENIAAGQPNAISAHSGWLNSHTGHRESLLGTTTRLGVGVYFGGTMKVYYTQNFYTPLRAQK